MATQYWAERDGAKVGPFPTREDALAAFRKEHPFEGEDYEARATRNMILTGYGADGAYGDIRWHAAR